VVTVLATGSLTAAAVWSTLGERWELWDLLADAVSEDDDDDDDDDEEEVDDDDDDGSGDGGCDDEDDDSGAVIRARLGIGAVDGTGGVFCLVAKGSVDMTGVGKSGGAQGEADT